MSDKDFKQVKELVKSKVLHEKVFEKFDAHIGTQVYGISLASFLQMASMEKISCRLKIQADKKFGYLHILNGDLIAAKTAGMTKQIADTLSDLLKPKGVGVVIKAEHLCMKARGVERQNSEIITSSFTGLFKSKLSTRSEFLNLIKS